MKLALVGLCLYKFFILHTLLASPQSWSCYSYFSLVYIHFNLIFVPDSLHLSKILSTYSVLNIGSQVITSFTQMLSSFSLSEVQCLSFLIPTFLYHVALLTTTACSSSSQPNSSECVAISVAKHPLQELVGGWAVYQWHVFWKLVRIREQLVLSGQEHAGLLWGDGLHSHITGKGRVLVCPPSAQRLIFSKSFHLLSVL